MVHNQHKFGNLHTSVKDQQQQTGGMTTTIEDQPSTQTDCLCAEFVYGLPTGFVLGDAATLE